MKLAVLKERRAGEARVAATPDTVKKLKSLGLEVIVESGAGAGARACGSAGGRGGGHRGGRCARSDD